MSVREVYSGEVLWIDVVDPTHAELEKIAADYGLPASAVQDCLEPEHLPKAEWIDGVLFAIFRSYDFKAESDATSITGMTRKVALFLTERRLIVVHRTEMGCLLEAEARWKSKLSRIGSVDKPQKPLVFAVFDIIHRVVTTYEKPLEVAEDALDAFEEMLFQDRVEADAVKEMLPLKRRVRLMKRLLRLSSEALLFINELIKTNAVRVPGGGTGATARALADVRETAAALHGHAEELQEDINSAIDVQMSLSAKRTNDVVRVLTLFSVFFMPLTFVVGVYGMNFEHMPELKWLWGYPGVWGVMVGITLGIYFWFRKNGWLK